jgi:hypothetical protein
LWVILVVAATAAGCSFGGGSGGEAGAITEIAGGPDYPLFDHTVTWTGDELVIVGGAGGDVNDGLLVDDPQIWASGDGFRAIATPPGPARNRHTAMWTGDEVLIWSGSVAPFGVGDGLVATAAAYNPSTDRWRTLAESSLGVARVSADAAMADRTVVVAGGDSPRQEDAGRIGVYDLDADQWSETAVAGRTVAVESHGGRVFVLWSQELDGDSGEARTHRLHLSVINYEGDRPGVSVVRGPDIEDRFWPAVDLVEVNGSLAIWAENDDDVSLWSTTSFAAGDRDPAQVAPVWNRITVEPPINSNDPMRQQARVHVVGDWLAVTDWTELVWIHTDDGAIVRQTLSSTQSCALESSGVTSTGDRLAAVGGWCTQAGADGSETDLHGAFWVEPPSR